MNAVELRLTTERILVRFPRIVTQAGLMQPLRQARRHLDRYSGLDALLDLSDVEHFGVSANDLRTGAAWHAARDGAHPRSRTRVAIVANSALTFGLARQFQSRRVTETTDVEIFSRTGEAEAWLDDARVAAPAEAS